MHCGKQINEGSAFCSVCGKPQQQAQASAPSTDTVPTQATVTSTPQGIAALDMPALLEAIQIANSVITPYMEALETESEVVEKLRYDGIWAYSIMETSDREEFLDFFEQNSYFGLKQGKAKQFISLLSGGMAMTIFPSTVTKYFEENGILELYEEQRQQRFAKPLEDAINANIQYVNLIPPNYRYPLALDEIYSYLANHRAESWKEAVNLYEEQLHRWKLEENSEEALLLQAQTAALAGRAASSAGTAALFSGLNFFFK